VHAVLLSVEKQKIQQRAFLPEKTLWRFLEVVPFLGKRAIRGLGVPFVGNDKNKASNQ
jgi:hypothetical protein